MTFATSTGPSSHLLAMAEPAIIYGTAWKKDETQRLVQEALAAGFRKIDTAAQPKHYQEHLVGAGLREAFRAGIVKRSDVYVQTKYTAPAGQDLSNMPYDPQEPLDTQVRTSVASSLRNLRAEEEDSEETSYVDCLLLHSPLRTVEETLQAWDILQSYVPARIRQLGISNVSLPVLEAIYNNSSIKPRVVQNRFYPATGYDGPLRKYCAGKGITYQSFWTLTGNPKLLRSPAVVALAQAANVSAPVALYSLVMDLGVVVLNGTTSKRRMEEDLSGVVRVREWARRNEGEWGNVRAAFLESVGGS